MWMTLDLKGICDVEYILLLYIYIALLLKSTIVKIIKRGPTGSILCFGEGNRQFPAEIEAELSGILVIKWTRLLSYNTL